MLFFAGFLGTEFILVLSIDLLVAFDEEPPSTVLFLEAILQLAAVYSKFRVQISYACARV